MSVTEDEQKLLDILSQPEITPAAGEEDSEKRELNSEEAVRTAFPELGPGAQRIMAKVLEAEMPTPEELERAERIAQHNAEISRKRRERLSQRKLRKIAGLKGKKGQKSPRRCRHG